MDEAVFLELVRQAFRGEVTVERDFYARGMRVGLALPGLNHTTIQHQFVISDIELREAGNTERFAGLLRARIEASRRDMANHLVEQAEELYLRNRSIRHTTVNEFSRYAAEPVSLERLAAVMRELRPADFSRGPALQEADTWPFHWDYAPESAKPTPVIRHDIEPLTPPKTRAELLKEDPF